MATKKHYTVERENIFLRMHPLYRVAISIVFSFIAYLLLPKTTNPLIIIISLWVVFAFFYTVSCWIIFFTHTIHQIKKTVSEDDGSTFYVFTLILIASFASMLTVLLLLISKDKGISDNPLFLPAVIGGMMLSWIMVHTVFASHYAHLYYDDDTNDGKKSSGGLDFPGEEKPDYIDFAYFSFVIGCTFQVSDVQITSRQLRRMVMLHGLLSFALNTFVVALTINLIAGLKQG